MCIEPETNSDVVDYVFVDEHNRHKRLKGNTILLRARASELDMLTECSDARV